MKRIIIDNISTSYFITEDGKCYNEKTGKWLKGQVNCRHGYFSYNLTLPDGSKKRCVAHRLVAKAFIPNDDPQKDEVNHIDGNKLNNSVDNLEWVTHTENMHHAFDNELIQHKHVYCFNKDKVLVAEYKTIQEAARAINCAETMIRQEVNKAVKTLTKGFYWSFEPILGATKDYKNTGKAKEVYQYDLNGKFIMRYSSTGEAARALGLKNPSHIGECCRGKIKTYKGFVWRYAEDIVSPSGESQRDTSEVS